MFKYNEKEYAQHIIKNGFGTKHINQELTILAKYFRDNGETDVKEELYKFSEQNLVDFDRVKYFKNINAAVKKAIEKNEKLIVIEEIPVTDTELERIESYEIDYTYKKVLFTMMVLERLNKLYYHLSSGKDMNEEHFFGGTAKNYKELVESSGIPYSKRNKSKHIHEIIHDLNNLGIVEIKNKGSVKLKFLYDIAIGIDKLSIKDFERIGLYYDYENGIDKIKKCESCEKPIKVTSNRTKYCSSCFDGNWKKYNAKKQKEYYKRKSV